MAGFFYFMIPKEATSAVTFKQYERKTVAPIFKKILHSIELNLIFFSFLLHFVWEFLQVPTYSGMSELNHWEGVKICTFATIGDIGFTLTAFFVASIAAKSRKWILHPTKKIIFLYLLVGELLTIGFEYYYINISHRFTYAEIMPLVPPFGTGLSPLLQWIFVPLLALWITKRQIR